MRNQKIKCDVYDCAHNDTHNCSCTLEEIFVCPCNKKASKNALKDTACSSYEYSEVHNKK